MSVTISAITCPQCGSSDLENKNGIWYCRSCGSKVVIEHDQAILQTETSQTSHEECKRIAPTFTRSQFLQAVYRGFAEDDAPLDIFDISLEEPSLSERQVLAEYVEAQVDYTAGIGYDRQEPYLTTERYYDSDLKMQRERYVTKYKTVTDWSTTDGSLQLSSSAVTENADADHIETALFVKSLLETDTDALEELSEDEQDALRISSAAEDRLKEEHDSDFYSDIKKQLPGDRSRDIRFTAHTTDRLLTLYKAPEYAVSFSFHGSTYLRFAYPFGKELRIGGDKIAGARVEKAEEVWNGTKIWTIAATILLLASIILSFALTSVVGVIISFCVAFAFFIAQEIVLYLRSKNVDKDYAERKRQALEKKLRTLSEEEAQR